ncbi:MAG: 16S rRNA (adenine(1518)-N(6)/adenine(1519)-N(6))-dimethyltransferase RsmA [Deltaproteobacteria bacterium]|jgi:16S rRNA (adenine1518-N6/adenine1519-N6)-dimethyltransferase|nr:16S rRNA (adenine(1518)-N(6)/adenine(1519)-N(6))-dimethyltransferase RsmA [Deltaproteobacteria bacterium]
MNSPRRQLDDLGLAPAKARGQNFLRDARIAGQLADLVLAQAKAQGPSEGAEPSANGSLGPEQEAGELREVLEIGPGLGALTRPLLERGLRVTAVELDGGLAASLSSWPETETGRLKVVHKNVLELNLKRDLPSLTPWLVFGNLPYNLSTPILFWFMEQAEADSVGLFMLQKEMAQRLSAPSGGRDYGRLTIAVSLWHETSLLRRIPPSAFEPRPTVQSSFICLKPKTNPPPSLLRDKVGRLTRAAFFARRKTIGNNLSHGYGKDKAALALETLKINPSARPETLEPEVFLRLAELLE